MYIMTNLIEEFVEDELINTSSASSRQVSHVI